MRKVNVTLENVKAILERDQKKRRAALLNNAHSEKMKILSEKIFFINDILENSGGKREEGDFLCCFEELFVLLNEYLKVRNKNDNSKKNI